MPFRDDSQSLRDIPNSIRLIREFVGEMTLEEFHADRKTEAAVERELQILTEAAFRLDDRAEALCPGPDWRNIRGFGNLLRHAYDSLLPERIWTILKEELPPLEGYVLPVLARLETRSAPPASS